MRAGGARLDRDRVLTPFLLGAAITAAYWPGTSGAPTSLRWIIAAVICSGLAFLCHRARPVAWADVLGALFVGWALSSFAWSETPLDTIGAGLILLVLVAAYMAGAAIEDMRPLWLGAAAGLLTSDATAIAQLAGWEGPLQNNVPAGLFINRNYFAEASALVLVGCAAEGLRQESLRKFANWAAAAAALPGVALTGCRGALLAILVLAVPLWRRSPLICLIALMLLGDVIVAITIGSVKLQSAHDRLDIWRAAWALVTPEGHGLGSFRESAPHIPTIHYVTRHAYNEFLEAAFEVGWIGAGLLVAFLALLICTPNNKSGHLGQNLNTSRFVLLALIVEACFDFPFHLPATALLGALCCGHLARDQYGIRVPAWARRMASRARLSPVARAAPG